MFYAIISEYDPSVPASVNELRAVLDPLRADALEHEDTPFDATGTSSIQDGESSQGSSERARSWHGDAPSHGTEDTEITGMSQALEFVDIHGPGGTALGTSASGQQSQLETLPTAEKLTALREMFPAVKEC